MDPPYSRLLAQLCAFRSASPRSLGPRRIMPQGTLNTIECAYTSGNYFLNHFSCLFDKPEKHAVNATTLRSCFYRRAARRTFEVLLSRTLGRYRNRPLHPKRREWCRELHQYHKLALRVDIVFIREEEKSCYIGLRELHSALGVPYSSTKYVTAFTIL